MYQVNIDYKEREVVPEEDPQTKEIYHLL